MSTNRANPSTRRERVTLSDVARAAGVSTNTVSRVVRGDKEVSAQTRAHVTALIESMGYRPNVAARALSAEKTGIIHVILTVPMDHGHGSTLLAVMQAATQMDYQISLSHAPDPEHTEVSDILPFRVDGVIVIGGQKPAASFAKKIGEAYPTVLLLTSARNIPRVSTIHVDSTLGSRIATEHLLSQGMTHLVHIRGPKIWTDALDRSEGYIQACTHAGVEPVIVDAQSWDANEGYAQVMKLGEAPEGIIAANDQLALGAIRALSERGIRVPKETAVVGFDNIAGADNFTPPLSTIHQPFEAIGKQAVTLLTAMMEGARARDMLIKPKLIIRASSVVPMQANSYSL